MGKYMKKTKITGDVGVMEVSQPTSLGVRTRAAKTLALQRLNSSRERTSPTKRDAPSSSYLELRSRRLEKTTIGTESRRPPQPKKAHDVEQESGGSFAGLKAGLRLGVASGDSVSVGSVAFSRSGVGKVSFGYEGDFVGCDANFQNQGYCDGGDGTDVGIEASFGENNLDNETRDRSTRESTPCNMIKESDVILTPGSSTRRSNLAARTHSQMVVPTTDELEEFFAYAEKQQQRLFIEKYNFDIVNDRPLPGRFDWVPVKP